MHNVENFKVGEVLETDWDSAVYHGCCNKCGDRLDWELSEDPDSPGGHTNCCNTGYHFSPTVVKFWIEEDLDKYD